MNKFYIQIVLFLLSIFVYVNNKAIATESAPEEFSPPQIEPLNITSEEVYEKSKDLLCTNPEEIKNAEKLMKEAIEHLKHYAISVDGFKYKGENPHYNMVFYKKNHKNRKKRINIEKIYYKVHGRNKYNEVLNMLWNPDRINLPNGGDVKIVRVYNPNLVLIEKRYEKEHGSPQKYFYALAAKAKISKYVTIIAIVSPNVNDHNPSKEKYENKIIDNANLFEIEVDSEDDIKKGKLKKTVVHLNGYLIERHPGSVNLTYIEAIDEHSST
ncbi:fam-a protein [Plasmodium chabaudi chabaudi]|uniref:Fam-a protein n=1 Tax=Plasmodium chabaudi chabaudi TaxID=31271 RepID=A0A4V0K3V6_PLACU|nr:fam-a protein [Plasmodium chabaudi chabaudi]VTZ67617.1 fam-a protein [Plasmodium chabaudi chabaudi]|eukprot:XP_016653380.1 fam-a protein [Plasmodium chabaudi chabaudi]